MESCAAVDYAGNGFSLYRVAYLEKTFWTKAITCAVRLAEALSVKIIKEIS